MKIFLSRLPLVLFVAVSLVASVAASAQAAKAAEKTSAAALSAVMPALIPALTPALTPALIPKHNCVRPDTPGKFESDGQQKLFVKQMDGYRDCLMSFRNDMNKLAQAHVDAANAAIEEFNSFVNTINKK